MRNGTCDCTEKAANFQFLTDIMCFTDSSKNNIKHSSFNKNMTLMSNRTWSVYSKNYLALVKGQCNLKGT